jgi:hypothetical protein
LPCLHFEGIIVFEFRQSPKHSAGAEMKQAL